jgi:hypothetical protein
MLPAQTNLHLDFSRDVEQKERFANISIRKGSGMTTECRLPINLFEYEKLAKERLSQMAFDYMGGLMMT